MIRQFCGLTIALSLLIGCVPGESDQSDETAGSPAPAMAGDTMPPGGQRAAQGGRSIVLLDADEMTEDGGSKAQSAPSPTAEAAQAGQMVTNDNEAPTPVAMPMANRGGATGSVENESMNVGGQPVGGQPMGGVVSAPPVDLFTPPAVDGCVPERARFDTDIGPHFEQYCGLCHGSSLAFGAPYTLTNYNGLFDAVGDIRVLDVAIAELSAGTMPPAGHMRPGTQVREDILDWATCGAWRTGTDLLPNPGANFDVDRNILMDLGEPPADSDFFELRANAFEIPPNVDDHYECFRFEAPVDEPRFIRRIETLIDDVRVLHHVVLVPDEAGEPNTNSPCDVINPSSLTYAWAPGQGALQFPEGGIRLEPGQRLTLNIHYNNTARHPDVRDSSGVRIYHSAIEGPEVAMLTFGPLDIRIPAGENGSASGWCQMPSDTNLLYSFPHMHDAGTGFSQVIEHDDDTETDIINIFGWDFDAQYIYDTPVALPRGTVVRTTCTYRNATERTIRFGENTRDEMCFNFSYISPPIGISACNQAERPRPLTYDVGQCAPAGAEALMVEAVNAPIFPGEAPALTGGDTPDGLWVLSAAKLYLPQDMIGPFSLDRDRSVVNVIGSVGIVDGQFFFDGTAQLAVVAGPLSTNLTQALSFGGPANFGPDDSALLDLTVTCGQLGVSADLQYELVDDRLKILAPIQESIFRLDLLLEYTRVP
ncbi:MAG: hypothetical protein VX589_05185 [Myxococcota bacterium]|nr:hypothetical protein [Myxococcota bacterium]